MNLTSCHWNRIKFGLPQGKSAKIVEIKIPIKMAILKHKYIAQYILQTNCRSIHYYYNGAIIES